jgi:hypothetical protein
MQGGAWLRLRSQQVDMSVPARVFKPGVVGDMWMSLKEKKPAGAHCVRAGAMIHCRA